MYILYAFLSLAGNCINTIFNKLGSKHTRPLLFSFLKAIFIVIFSFIFVWATGGINQIFAMSVEQIIFLVIGCAGYVANYIFYLIAIKKSNLYAFSPFTEITQLLFGNVLFLIFLTSSTVNLSTPWSLVLYLGGVALLLAACLIIVFNKFLNENCDKRWLIFAALASFCLAIQQVCVSAKLGTVNVGIISLWSGVSLLVVGFVGSLIFKQFSDMKGLHFTDYLFIILSALGNTLTDVSLFLAYQSEGCNQSIVLTIFSLNYVIVFVISCLANKKKIKFVLWLLTLLDFIGMILFFLSGIVGKVS